MRSRERVLKTLRFEHPDRTSRELWALPGIMMHRTEEYEAVKKKYPEDFVYPKVKYGRGKLAKGNMDGIGNYTDEWGCIWKIGEPGVCGEVKYSPLDDIANLDKMKPPYEILENADFSEVNKSVAETDKFVKAGTTIRLFERVQFLRGPEKLYMDLAYQTREVRKLLGMVHEFYMTELEKWVKTDVDGISYMDDWGAQKSLLISPEMWRHYFKPLYKEYNELIHKHGKHVFFHSDGFITPIFGELIEIGMDAINSQLFCQDIEDLGKKYKGKITFWGEIDRQHILPFGSVDEVKEAVRRVRHALDDSRGGVIAQCEWGLKDPRENIEAVFETWMEDRKSIFRGDYPNNLTKNLRKR